jgi:hypothetical protein
MFFVYFLFFAYFASFAVNFFEYYFSSKIIKE